MKAPPPQSLSSSLDLLELARSGDREALEILFARYLPRLERLVTGWLPGWARALTDTSDLVQETLVHFSGRIREFKPRDESSIISYLAKSARNAVNDEMKRACNRYAGGEIPAELADRGRSPEELVSELELWERYESAMTRLPERHQAAVNMFGMGYSYQEIALALGFNSSESARIFIRRALQQLQRAMRL